MARSPLLRSLVGLAREEAVSRRTVVRGAAAAATATWAMGWAPGHSRAFAATPRSSAKVAIVGGGISGLAAALQLMDQGVDATVYEASGRVGGRMFSQRGWDGGQVSEWCGELIDTGHVTIQALATRFNLPLDDLRTGELPGATETYHFFGKAYPRAAAVADFAAIAGPLAADLAAAGPTTSYSVSTPGGRALDLMSIYDWIETRVPGGHQSPLGQLLDAAYVIEFGADTRDQSALNLIYLLAYQDDPSNFQMFGQSDERYHIRGGNDQLPAAIAAALGSRVVLHTRLEALSQTSAGRVTLSLASGLSRTEVAYDVVILALPFPALARADLTHAGFDALKLKTIAELGRARNGKLHVQTTRRVWQDQASTGTSYSDSGYQCSWDVSRAQPGKLGILVDYTGGGRALWPGQAFQGDRSPLVRAAARRFLAQAEPVFPGLTAAWTGKASASHPHLDPNLGLSYSYWKVGQYQTIAGYEMVVQGRCHFAGEQCSANFQGYMEGGAAEGVRAANEVLGTL